MLFFHKRTHYYTNLFEGSIDFHNHLLPGIDDGSKSIAQSLQMVDAYQSLGFRGVLCSPHIFMEYFPNTPWSIGAAFDQLSGELLKVDKSDFLLGYTAEYMLDESFLELLNSDQKLLPVFNNYLLVELPFFFNNKQLLIETILHIRERGFIPILAHPERYFNLNSLDFFIDLKSQGCYLQGNALSFIKHYGERVSKKAEEMLSSKLFDFICSDAHRLSDINKLSQLRLTKSNYKIWKEILDVQRFTLSNSLD